MRFAGRSIAVVLVLLAQGAARAEKSGVRPNVISVPAGPGTIKGLGEQFEPSLNTGSATYKVDLDVPPGTAGFTPSLALRYDSGQGDGTVGIGWSLDVGSVQRQTAYGVPEYGAADRFVWEGQELVPMGGGVYRLKIEGAFLRFPPVRRSLGGRRARRHDVPLRGLGHRAERGIGGRLPMGARADD